MKLKASLMFAKSLIFPKAEKNSSARKSMFGALLCIGLSIVPLVVVLTVTNGMIEGMTERIIGLSSSHIDVLVARKYIGVQSAENFDDFSKNIELVDGVVRAYPEVSITALAGGKKERAGAQIRGVPADIFTSNKDFSSLFSVVDGEVERFVSGEKNVVVGQKISENLGLGVGDTIRIITTKNNNGIITPRISSFKICAIVSSGYQELDALWIFVPIDVVYNSLSLDAASYSVLVETNDAFSPLLEKVRWEIQDFCGDVANVYTWSEMNASELESFASTKVMLVFIMALIVLVASVNISSAIVMLVMERRKEIAILKSVGASSQGITFSFLLAGVSCGVGGVLIGLPIGLLLSVNINGIVSVAEKIVNAGNKFLNILKGIPLEEISEIHLMDPAYYLSEIPITIPFSQIFGIVCATLVLSLLVSVIPSRKAGKEKPVVLMQKV